MGRFILGDELQVQEKFFAETGVDKVLELEAVERLLIKGVLEMFELDAVSALQK